jgi:hypothetical protein
MALSFLGKTRPFHKLPVMEFKGETVTPVSFEYETEDEKLWNKFFDGLRRVIGMSDDKQQIKDDQEMSPEEILKIKNEVKVELAAQFKETGAGDYAAKFKEEFGCTPEEFKAKQAAQANAVWGKRVELFAEGLKKKHSLAPALVDGFMVPLCQTFSDRADVAVKFAENQSGDVFAVLEKFAETIAAGAKNNTLVVDFSETAGKGGDSENPNLKGDSSAIDFKLMTPEQADVLDKKILRFMQDNKIENYQVATLKFLELNPKG